MQCLWFRNFSSKIKIRCRDKSADENAKWRWRKRQTKFSTRMQCFLENNLHLICSHCNYFGTTSFISCEVWARHCVRWEEAPHRTCGAHNKWDILLLCHSIQSNSIICIFLPNLARATRKSCFVRRIQTIRLDNFVFVFGLLGKRKLGLSLSSVWMWWRLGNWQWLAFRNACGLFRSTTMTHKSKHLFMAQLLHSFCRI